MKRTLIFATVLAAGVPLTAVAQQTKVLTADKHNEYGLVYTLPVTAVEVEVTAVREVRKAGPYYIYAKKYTGSETAIKEDSERWTIQSVTARTYGVADGSQKYLMQLKPGATTFIGVDADGMLLSINANPKPAAGITASVEEKVPGEVSPVTEYLDYVNQDFVSSQSSAKQAQMLGESLMEVRESKTSLTRGTAETMPADGRQLELMLNSLERQESAISAAFLGTVTRETYVRRYTFLPEEGGNRILFRMSDFAGFVDAGDYSGEPVYIDVEVTARGELPVDAKGVEKKLPKDAVAYKVPGAAIVSVTHKGRKLFSREFEMGQFGVVFGLNPLLFSDKKDPSYAVFDPVTGGLSEIGSAKESATQQ